MHQQIAPQKHHNPPPPQQQQIPQQGSGIRYRALYDYEAQDVDELGFMEGDLIVDCTPVRHINIHYFYKVILASNSNK
jgi:hypothetical protein